MELAEYLHASDRVSLFSKSYLTKVGWFRSLQGIPTNNDGLVPWITYPAFRQLKRIVRPEFRVFEFGCGASSVWWANQVSEVVSVEHDAVWAARVISEKPKNLTVTVRQMNAPLDEAPAAALEAFFSGAPDLPTSGDMNHNIMHGLLCREFLAYAAELARYPAGHFDVIVVDGMARSLTAWLAGQFVKPGGFILFDNADRWQYNAGYRALASQGFRRLDYYGPGPVNVLEWCTSIFAKNLDAFAQSVDSPRGDNDLGW
jgi:hypothetical protein